MFIVDHHIFTHDDKNYVINVDQMTAFPIDEETVAALANITTDSNCQLDSEIRVMLIDIGLLDENELAKTTENVEIAETFPITSIALFITQECNLNCVYCYGGGGGYGSFGHMTSETAKTAVDWLFEHSGKVIKLGISFFGGEPFMNFPLMKEVAEYADKLGKAKDKIIEFTLATNLSLLDDEKLAFLQKYKIIPMVSFDGPKSIQDKQRPFKNRNDSSYDATIPKIRKLLAVIPGACCRATLMEHNDPAVIREALCEIGFNNIIISPASGSLLNGDIGCKERNFTGSMRMLESDAKLILESIQTRNREELNRQKDIGDLLIFLGEFLQNQKRHFPCGAGRGSVGVSNSGDIYLCHRFVGAEEYKLGSIHDCDLNRKVYLKPSINSVEKCSKCFARHLCCGGCHHDNTSRTGSVFEPPEDTCRLMRRTIELVAYIASNLSGDDIDYLLKEKIIPPKLPTQKELRHKKQNLLSKLEELEFTEEEFMEMANGLTLDEYKSKFSQK